MGVSFKTDLAITWTEAIGASNSPADGSESARMIGQVLPESKAPQSQELDSELTKRTDSLPATG